MPRYSTNASNSNPKQNILTIVKSAPETLSSFVKSQATEITKSSHDAKVAFKKGKLKEGFKDLAEASYATMNLATLGSVGTVVKGEEKVHLGDEQVPLSG